MKRRSIQQQLFQAFNGIRHKPSVGPFRRRLRFWLPPEFAWIGEDEPLDLRVRISLIYRSFDKQAYCILVAVSGILYSLYVNHLSVRSFGAYLFYKASQAIISARF